MVIIMKQSLLQNDLEYTDISNELSIDIKNALMPIFEKYGSDVPRLELLAAVVIEANVISARKHVMERVSDRSN